MIVEFVFVNGPKSVFLFSALPQCGGIQDTFLNSVLSFKMFW